MLSQKECLYETVDPLYEGILEGVHSGAGVQAAGSHLRLIVPLVTAKIIDVGIANRDVGYIWKMGGVMLILAACGLCFAVICQYFAAKCATDSARRCGGSCIIT